MELEIKRKLLSFPVEKLKTKFELLEWLSSKQLTVKEAVELLEATTSLLKKEASEVGMELIL